MAEPPFRAAVLDAGGTPAGGRRGFSSRPASGLAELEAGSEPVCPPVSASVLYTCKELTFVRNILNDLGHPLAGPIVIGVDNEAAIKICENQGVTARNKHFQDSIHYFRDMNARNYVVPTFVRTDVQHADDFTHFSKPGPALAHSSCHGLNVSFARSFCIPMIVVFYGILPWGSTHDCINRNLSMQNLYELRGSVGTQECSLVPMHLVGVSPPILVRSGVPS